MGGKTAWSAADWWHTLAAPALQALQHEALRLPMSGYKRRYGVDVAAGVGTLDLMDEVGAQ